MRKLLYLLIFGATLARAQTTLTIPAPDGKTIVSKDNVWSCVQQGGSAVTYANGILTVNGVQVNLLSLTQLNLTGGTTPPDGDYLAHFVAGAPVTWKAYVPPASGGATTPPGKVFPVAVPQQAGWGLNYYLMPNAVVAAGQTYSASPVLSGAPPATWNYITWATFVNSAGQIYLRVGNGTGNVFAASQWTVTIK